MKLLAALAALLISQTDAFAGLGPARIPTARKSALKAMPEFSAIPGSMWLADASEAVSEAAADMMIPSNVDIVDQVSTGGVPQEVIIGGVLALVLAAGAVAVVGQMSSAPTAGSSAPKAVTPPKAAAPVAPTPPKATPPPSPKAETKNEEKPADYDVSVPYDAAARLAYVEMLSKLTPPNDAADYYFSQYLIEEEPFAVFKKQYEEETVAAIKAKQKVPVQA